LPVFVDSLLKDRTWRIWLIFKWQMSDTPLWSGDYCYGIRQCNYIYKLLFQTVHDSSGNLCSNKSFM